MTTNIPGQVQPHGRVVQTRKVGRGELKRGWIWVEVYLPLDVQAFQEFTRRWVELGSATAVEAADPDLARRALTPIDSHGDAMLQEDVLQLAHAFMVQSRKIDVMHDEQQRGSVRVIQSFVNTPEINAPEFWPGAWVVVLEVDPGTPEWDQIEDGTLRAVSFQALARRVPVTASLED